MAEHQPDTLALAVPRGGGGGGGYDRFTFAGLDHEVDTMVDQLRNAGVTPGMRTAVLIKVGHSFFVTVFALFRLGAVPVMIDPGIGLANFGRCLTQARPQALVGIRKAVGVAKLLKWARRSLSLYIVPGRRLGVSGCAPEPDPAPPATAAILFTSGSTGPPKGAVYTHANFNAQIDALRDLYNIEPGETDLCTFPLFALFAPALGMSAIVPRMDFTRPGRVDPRNIIEPINALGVTNLFGSPALLDRVGRGGGNLPTVRRVVTAGAPVQPTTIERFTQMLPKGAQVFTPYGATEALPVCSIGSDEILAETRERTDRGEGVCVGRPVESVELAVIPTRDEPIATWSDDLSLPPGEIGEIVVKGSMVTLCYFDQPQANALAKIEDRHRMGDLGYVDDRGRLWFCGRKSHRVITSTRTHFTVPCESPFNVHPRVYRSALVKVGDRPVICIETEQGRSPHGLRDELLQIAQRHEHTRDIREVLFHRSFPVDIRHNAKINRERLARWAAGQLQ